MMNNRILFLLICFLFTQTLSGFAADKPGRKQNQLSTVEQNDEDENDATLGQQTVAPVANQISGAVTESEEEDEGDEEEASDENFEFHGEAKFLSNYLQRGLTQTDSKPALQTDFIWDHSSGFFLGIWGTTVRYPEANVSLEMDARIGYVFSLGKDLYQSIAVHRFTYFSSERNGNWNYEEATEWKDFKLAITYTPSYRSSGHVLNVNFQWQKELPWEVLVGVSAGYTMFGNQSIRSSAVVTGFDDQGDEITNTIFVYENTPNYADFKLSLSKEVFGVNWALEGVYLKRQKIEGILARPRLVFIATKEF